MSDEISEAVGPIEVLLGQKQAEIERLRERVKWFEDAGGVAMGTRVHEQQIEIEGLLNQNQEIAASNADHVRWRREAEAKLARVVEALSKGSSSDYGRVQAALAAAKASEEKP